MSSKIYVGNLSFQTENYDLEKLFAQNGVVTSVNIIKDRDTGRAKGFGFVEMENTSEAKEAILFLNATEFMGRRIRVNMAENKTDSFSNKRRY